MISRKLFQKKKINIKLREEYKDIHIPINTDGAAMEGNYRQKSMYLAFILTSFILHA